MTSEVKKEHTMSIEIRARKGQLNTVLLKIWCGRPFGMFIGQGVPEHLILHQLRQHPKLSQDLSRILLVDGQIVGHILFSKAQLRHEKQEKSKKLPFWPLCHFTQIFKNRGWEKFWRKQPLTKPEKRGFSIWSSL